MKNVEIADINSPAEVHTKICGQNMRKWTDLRWKTSAKTQNKMPNGKKSNTAAKIIKMRKCEKCAKNTNRRMQF